jgi:phage gpG-like protein
VQIRIRVQGAAAISAALTALGERMLAETRTAVLTVLEQVARQERTLLSLGWHPAGTPTGSLPGTPPWRVSGDLSRSTRAEPPTLRGATWTGRAGPTSAYGRIHELGGWTGAGHRTYLPARPHLRPAWEIVRPTVAATFTRAWARATRPG